MNVTDQLLAALLHYGLPALFAVNVTAAKGARFSASFMQIAAGSFVEQGTMTFWRVLFVASTAAVVGDQIG